MKFDVTATRIATGKPIRQQIEAASVEEIYRKAAKEGVQIESIHEINEVATSPSEAAVTTPEDVEVKTKVVPSVQEDLAKNAENPDSEAAKANSEPGKRPRTKIMVAACFALFLIMAGLFTLNNVLGGLSAEQQAKKRTADATKNAWNTLYRTDTIAMGQWNADRHVDALTTMINGYQFDCKDVDSDLVVYIDEQIRTAGELKAMEERWLQKKQEVDEVAEGFETKLGQPLAKVTKNPTAMSVIVSIGTEINRQIAQSKVDEGFQPEYDAEFEQFKSTLNRKYELRDAFSKRYGDGFPIGFVFGD
jgi:hypothetical protein